MSRVSSQIHIAGNRYLWLIPILLVFLVLAAPIVSQLAINNLVWLSVSWHILDLEAPMITSTEAALSSQIMQAAQSNPRTSMGLGVLAALRGDESSALTLWQQGKDIEQLLAFGWRAWANGLPDLAILYFRSAGDLQYEQGWYGIGQICQSVLARPEKLAPRNQERCAALFQQNGLILNGDFTPGTLDGWVKQNTGATVAADAGMTGGAVVIRGDGSDERQSVYQRFALPVGSVVRFSAYVRPDRELPPNIRLLYIGFRKPDGSAAGNSLTMEGVNLIPHQWNYVERTYTVPPAQDERFLFGPAQVYGLGQILVDQVRLEILEQP